MRSALLAVMTLLCAVAVGCQDVAPPPIFAPGPASVQRTRAQRFDPYPDPQVAHDDGSARPRDYMHPPSDADVNSRSLPNGRPINYPERWQSVGN